MTATCKYCGSQAVQWATHGGRYVLLEQATGENHKCAEYETAHPRTPAAALRKNPARKGSFLRWYGPRAGRTEAVLVEPNPDRDTPAGLYLEPQYSGIDEVRRARGWK